MIGRMVGVREQSRARTTAAILAAARAEIAEHGGGGLSMRAVAREVGMVSSAVYRYFPTREALLTAMILESYEGLASALGEVGVRQLRDQTMSGLAPGEGGRGKGEGGEEAAAEQESMQHGRSLTALRRGGRMRLRFCAPGARSCTDVTVDCADSGDFT